MDATSPQFAQGSTLQLTRSAYDALRVHAEQAYPAECCGVLLGRPAPEGWRVAEAVRTTNASADSARDRYSIAPAELVKIEMDARHRGLDIAGFYHSHPDHPAQWSRTDLAEAHWFGCSYVITQVVQGRALATCSFLLAGDAEKDKRFEPETILVDGQALAVLS